MMHESPAETYQFLVDSEFVASVVRLFPGSPELVSHLLLVLTELVRCAGKLGAPCPVTFDAIECAVGFLDLKSTDAFNREVIVPAVSFVFWLLWHYWDWHRRVIGIGGFERCLEVFRFANEWRSSADIAKCICGEKIGMEVALAIGLLLRGIEVEAGLASELSGLLYALWEPTETRNLNSHSLFCLRALLLRYPKLEIGPFLPGIYRLMRMENEPALSLAFEILSFLPPETVDLVTVVQAALLLLKGSWAQEESCVVVLRALERLADGLKSPAILFGIDGFVPHILELIEREGFRIRTECAKLLAVMIQMLDPDYYDECRALLEQAPVIIAALIGVLEAELDQKWRLVGALHVILTQLDGDGKFRRMIAEAIPDELWDQLKCTNDLHLKAYVGMVHRICCGFDEMVG
jgi:hypothetical protein